MTFKVPAGVEGAGSIAGPGPQLVTLAQLAEDASGDGLKVLAGDGAFKSVAAVAVAVLEPESGDTTTIGDLPSAATAMGSTDTVTGLQGGANVNFSQAQLLATPNAASAGSLAITAGNSSGAADSGGSILITSGNAASGISGDIVLTLGTGSESNGNIIVVNLPIADPHIVGALWINSHVLTVSAGP